MKKIKTRLLTAVTMFAGAGLLLSGCFVPIPIPIPVPGPSAESSSKPQPGIEPEASDEVEWEECGDGFKCATVSSPMDWENPDGKQISLYLVKQPAKGTNKLGTLFVNPGGPGGSGASFVRESINYAVGEELQQQYDVIGWDPRGVGQSSAVFCYDQAEMDEYLFGDPREFSDFKRGSDEWLEVARAEEKAFGEACLANTGELLGFVDTVSTVRDLDRLRQLVGDPKLNYLGYSYGTFIGALYADMFAQNVGHMVLDGALAPDVTLFEVVLMQQQGFEAATKTYLNECLSRSSCPFDGTVETAMAEIGELIEKVDKNPIQADDGRWVSSGTFITAIILPLYNEDNWPLLNDLFAEMREGQPDTAQFLADYYFSRNLGFYEDNSTEAFSAINCLDYPAGGDAEQMRKEAAQIAKAAPTFGPYAGFGDVSCEVWPFDGPKERGPVRAEGSAPILVIGTTGDPATPYAWAERLVQQLESGVLITNNGEGHGAYTSGNMCIDRTVEEYFLLDLVPSEDPDC
ncbi:MAG TPA: alpha/beta hydrolase [Microbacteriaceae bacterium]|nr:alpha/beta hydrolase [Microbacteriaceae bacterium]